MRASPVRYVRAWGHSGFLRCRRHAGKRLGARPDACACRETFCSHAPRAAFQSRAGVRAPPKPARVQVGRQFPRGSSARVLDEWARRRRCGACLWRSCTSGVECTAQLAVGTLRLPRAVRQKGPCEARGVTHAGLREPASGFCDALGARCAAPAALLRCESQFPSDACAACTKASERAARGSQGMARALGCGQVGGGGPLATTPSRRGVLAAGGGGRRTL